MREQKNLQQENGKEHARTHMRRLSYVSTGFYYFTMNSVDAYFIIFPQVQTERWGNWKRDEQG